MTTNKTLTYYKNATSSAAPGATDACADILTGLGNVLVRITAQCMVRI